MSKQGLSKFEYEDRILASLRKRKGVATVGDVAADSGLPLGETEQTLRHMLSFYKSHLDVDDDGNLLYRFDPELKRRGEEPGRAWHNFKKAMWTAFMAFFKVWIMVTLVGYTAIFILLLLAVGIAGMAASSQSDNDRGGGELLRLPLILVMRILEMFFWINLFDDRRGYGGGYQTQRGYRQVQHKAHKKTEKPVYQRIFDYVFGPQLKSDPLAAERAFAQFVRMRRGRITAAEWSSRTGLSLANAENALTASVMRYSGDIDVSNDGTLIYTFDELRVTSATDSERASSADLPPIWERKVKVTPLTGNKGSTNTWITIFNGFNLLMSAAVLSMAGDLMLSSGETLALTIGLGWVPLVFSLMFFFIPFIRSIQRRKAVRQAAKENERRQMMQAVFLSTETGTAYPVHQQALPEPMATQLLNDFEGDIKVSSDGQTAYVFPRVAEQFRDAQWARQAAQENVVFGKTVFSSDEEKLSLAQSELEEFDRRFARELGGDVGFDFDSVSASADSYAQVGRH